MNGQTCLKELSKMSEDDRLLCQLEWVIEPSRVYELLEAAVDDVVIPEEGTSPEIRAFVKNAVSKADLVEVLRASFSDMREAVLDNYFEEFEDTLRKKLRETIENVYRSVEEYREQGDW